MWQNDSRKINNLNKACDTQVVIFSTGQNTQTRYLKATQAFCRDIPDFVFEDETIIQNFATEPLATVLNKRKKVKND